MLTHCSVIREAYRAALSDWTAKEVDGRAHNRALIRHTATLASIWTNDTISEERVVEVLRIGG